MRSTRGTAFALTAATLAMAVPGAFAQDARTPRQIYKGAGPAVVVITTPSSLGSGVLIDAAGLIVTNLHVIEDSSEASVKLANGDVYDDIRVVDYDDGKDLVLLRIKGDRLPVVELGDSETVETGDSVYAIGAPNGLEQTFSAGIVSAIRDTGAGYHRIQTTTPISHGSSGGGLFDSQGLLVGITQAIQDGENLNFAIPINLVKGMLEPQKAPLTIADVKARVAQARAARSALASATTPALASEYVAQNGNILAFEKAGQALRATFSDRNGARYADASLEWNAAAGAFIGRGTLAHACGQKAVMVPTTVAIVTVDPSTIRYAWLQPDKVNCRSGKVESSSPRVLMWVASPGADTPHQ